MATEESAAQWMKIAEVKTAEPFKDLFPVHEGILQDITASMQRHGYDSTQPIILWEEEAVVLDGHTRLAAAQAAGIKQIPVVFRSCKDEDAALDYAIHLQVDRRNLEDKDVMRLILILDKRGQHGGDRRSADFKTANAGLKAEATATRIGTSRDKIERARYILDHGDDKLKMLVLHGTISIRSAYNRIQAQKAATIKCKFTKTAQGVSVSRVALVKALRAVLPGVDYEGGALVGLETFYFEPKWVRTYNDYISVSHPLDTGLSTLKGGVPSKACYGVVRYIDGDTVELKANAKGLTIFDWTTTLHLRYVKSKVGEYIKSSCKLGEVKWHPLPANFAEAVKVCTLSVGPENSGLRAGYYINKDEVMTTDRFRATLYRLDKPMELGETVLDGVFLRQVLRVGGELTHYGFSNGWAHFKNAVGTIFSTRALVGKFPSDNVHKVIQPTAGLATHRFPDGLRASLERVCVLGKGIFGDKEMAQLRFVHLRKENGYLLCESKRDVDEIVDRIKLNPDECPMDIATNVVARHLMDALAYTQEFAVDKTLMHFRVGNWQHVMILRPSLEEVKKEEPKPEKQKLRRPVSA